MPLPLNLGSGSSVSHLCDQTGCVRKDHLEVAIVHQTNMNRQRCVGMTLVVIADFIVAEIACKHAAGTYFEKLTTCCRKVQVLEVGLGDAAFVVESIMSVINASQNSSQA